MQELQAKLCYDVNERAMGKTYKVLVEGTSKRSDDFVHGRNSQNVTVILPKGDLKPGEYVNVKISSFTSATLKGDIV